MNEYKKKYIKYKTKYSNLKKTLNLQEGGNENYVFDYKFGISGNHIGNLINPNYIIQLHNSNLAICDYDNSRIQIFDLSGNFLGTFGQDNEIIIGGMIQLTNGNIAVVGKYLNCVKIFDMLGNFLYKFGNNRDENENISEDGKFYAPTSIIQLTNGNLAILDTGNYRVQIFDILGNFISKFGKYGTREDEFIDPQDILQLTNGNIAVLDTKRIQFFDINGNWLGQENLINTTNYMPNLNFINNFILPFRFKELNDNKLLVIFEQRIRIQRQIQRDSKIYIYTINNNGNYNYDYEINNSELLHINDVVKLSNNNLAFTDNINNKIVIFKKNNEQIELSNLPSQNLETSQTSQTSQTFQTSSLNFNNDNVINIKDVIKLLNYIPYIPIEPIIIKYILLKNGEKIFNFQIKNKKEYIVKNITNTNDSIIINETIEYINILDTLYNNSMIIFIPYYKLNFNFYDIITNKLDVAIDAGGLTNTVFYQLSKYFIDNEIYFQQDVDTKLYNLRFIDNQEFKSKMFCIGQLFGLAIKLGITIDINLNPLLLYQIAHDIDIDNIDEEQIKNIVKELDPKLLNTLPYLCYNSEMALKKPNYCLFDEDGNEVELNNLIIDTTKKIKSNLESSKIQTELFVKGFRSQINIYDCKLYRLPINQLDILITGIKELTYDTFIKNLKLINFTNLHEEILKNIILKNIFKNNDYLELLLTVMTGINKIPAVGFPQLKQLRFEIINDGYKPIDIHTCFNQFMINKNLFDEYENSSNIEMTQLVEILSYESLQKLKNDFSSI